MAEVHARLNMNCRLVFFGGTTYDVHRSIKNNEQPPTREQMEALQDYINSKKRSSEAGEE